MGTSCSRAAARPRSKSFRSNVAVNVGSKSRFTYAGALYPVNSEPITLLLRQARNACRLMPLFSARTVISASDCATTPRNRLWQSLTVLATSPSPTYVTPRPSIARYGSVVANASLGPETAAVIFPARTTLGLPITGAASRAVPRSAISAQTRAEASGDTVEQSTSTLGAAPLAPDIRPFRPSTAEIRSSDDPTVMNTMSLAPSSAAVPTGLAPSRTSGSALADERL